MYCAIQTRASYGEVCVITFVTKHSVARSLDKHWPVEDHLDLLIVNCLYLLKWWVVIVDWRLLIGIHCWLMLVLLIEDWWLALKWHRRR